MRVLLNTNHPTARTEDVEDAEKRRSSGKKKSKKSSGEGRKWIWRRREEQQRQHGPAVGARLYFNYTAGCESLVQSRCFSVPPCFSVSLISFRLSSLADEPRCTTEMRRNKNWRRTGGTAHRFSPPNRVRRLQHRSAPTPDRFSLLSFLHRLLSLSLSRSACRFLSLLRLASSTRRSGFTPDA